MATQQATNALSATPAKRRRWPPEVSILLVLVGIALALYVGPMLLDALGAGLRSAAAPGPALGMLRSPMVWSALLAAAAAALVDRGWSRH